MADILNLRCDAWLLPTDFRRKIEPHRLRAHPDLRAMAQASGAEKFRTGLTLAEPVRGWETESPLPVLTTVPDDGF